ncbi:MAG: 3-deoxy-8-phosphooctulonate synthase [Thermotogae bacterium]|nr:3-deoxy-8-phosphooctulonate synthase [Thermotogota bacterium]
MNAPFFVAGPCVIESEGMVLEVAHRLKEVAEEYGVRMIFKASYDKANRTSITSFRGPGLYEGLRILAKVKEKVGLPVLTDVHDYHDVTMVAQVVDVVQIPAFLSRQTDLVVEAGKSGKIVNIKKAQFMAPWDVKHSVEKAKVGGAKEVWVTERGTVFGYNDLVVDMRGLVWMKREGFTILYDATHSLQTLSGRGKVSGGYRDLVPHLLRAAVSVGVDGVFAEVHPNPSKALSDSATQVPLGAFPSLVEMVLEIHEAARRWYGFNL